LSGWLIETGIGLAGFLAGLGVTFLARALRRRANARVLNPASGADPDTATFAELGSDLAEGNGVNASRPEAGRTGSPHLIGLLARAFREPLAQLRRSEDCPAEALRQLERIAWQTRMLCSAPRPMQGKLLSPISLLQEVAEEDPLLRNGSVVVSWSLLNRHPVHVDPERARAAFREIFAASAERCGEGGRMAIRILQGSADGYPVQIEVEIGRPGVEADSLAFLVARHVLESQGGRVEVDGCITRIQLRGSLPEATPVPAQIPSNR
jgi:hypothetical protein